MKKLVIISHTEHQYDENNKPVGWGATVREINFLASYWDQIVHIACLNNSSARGSSIGYNQPNIRFKAIPFFKGRSFRTRLEILMSIPGILNTIHRELKDATEVQLRLPTWLGPFLLLYFKLFKKKQYLLWIKYAGDWGKPSGSFSSRLQQQLLAHHWINCIVTINGIWPNQPNHCISFTNPCLTDEQCRDGKKYISTKSTDAPFNLLFVGRVDYLKGIDLLIEAIDENIKDIIAHFHIVGDGALSKPLSDKLNQLTIPHTFHGFMPQEEIVSLYKLCHFLVLPSRVEGFPKVVAEALSYGCLPIVSQVGSIAHFIKEDDNGFLLSDLSVESLKTALQKGLTTSPDNLIRMRNNGHSLATSFTYNTYINDLKTKVFQHQVD